MRVKLSGRGTLTGRARCLSDVACGLTAICCCARRSWIPARREGVLEANSVFSRLIGDGSGLREQSGSCRTKAARFMGQDPSLPSSPLPGLGELWSPLGIFRDRTSLLFVLRDNLAGGSEHLDLAVAKPQTELAHPSNVRGFMVYQDRCVPLFDERIHPLKTLLFERSVSYRDDFV